VFLFLWQSFTSQWQKEKKKEKENKASATGTKVFFGGKMAQNYHHIMTIYFFEVAIF
jgi:hypothetical protein